jgi:hypothetical protein
VLELITVNGIRGSLADPAVISPALFMGRKLGGTAQQSFGRMVDLRKELGLDVSDQWQLREGAQVEQKLLSGDFQGAVYDTYIAPTWDKLLGFFADRDRVSFHWPLPGYLALLPLAPLVLARWPRGWRIATWVTAGLGLAAVLGYYVIASVPAWRAQTASRNFHPTNFAGWDALADTVRHRLALMPSGTRLVAGDFKLGAEMGFALGDADIPVLDHPLNYKHGRTPQLALWGVLRDRLDVEAGRPILLAVAANDVEFGDLLGYYHRLCEQAGPLPVPQVLDVDHGRQRFLLFAIDARESSSACVTPALAFLDAPSPSATVGPAFDVAGWAFKDGVGLTGVEILLDGRAVARANYGAWKPDVAGFWKISTDPNQPRVGFRAHVTGAAEGTHWLGLRLHGADGSVEDWAEQRIVIQ